MYKKRAHFTAPNTLFVYITTPDIYQDTSLYLRTLSPATKVSIELELRQRKIKECTCMLYINMHWHSLICLISLYPQAASAARDSKAKGKKGKKK